MNNFKFGVTKKEEPKINNFKIPEDWAHKIKKNLNFHIDKAFIGWIVSFILVTVIVVLLLFFKYQKAQFEDTMMRLEYREEKMQEFFMEQRKENARIAKSDIDKENYIAYFSTIMTDFYAPFPTSRNRELSQAEKRQLLGIIYDYAKGPGFPYTDEFLPIAFLRVESHFYQYNSKNEYLTGTSGEKSMFQFMPATAREIYRRHGRDFDSELWYKDFNECVWLWFTYVNEISFNFKDAELETRIRWTAYAYNRGFYRNEMLNYYNNGFTIEKHLQDWPYKNQGNENYNKEILYFYNLYKSGFRD